MTITLNDNTRFLDLQLGVYDQDLLTFSRTTEAQAVEYVNKCNPFGILLAWLNSLGGWEHWLWEGEKDYRIDIDSDIIAEKNLFQDWDTDFINDETGQFFSFVEAYNQRTLRTTQLTPNQVDAIAKIKFSIQVQEIDENNLKRTVLVDKGSITARRDKDFFSQIAVNIRDTNAIPIQEQ